MNKITETAQMLVDWENRREEQDRFLEETNRVILTATPSQIRQVQKAGTVTSEDRIDRIQESMEIKARAAQAQASGKTDYARILFRRARQEVQIADMFLKRG